MRGSFRRMLDYIYWKKEETLLTLTVEEMKEKIEWYKENGHSTTAKTRRDEWLEDGTYRLSLSGYWQSLYCIEKGKYVHYQCNTYNNQLNRELKANPQKKKENTGAKSNSIEQKIFRELNGVSERKAFGYSEQYINRCVPKQLYYHNALLLNTNLQHISKADFSSHYPDHMRGMMPQWQHHKQVEGTVKPTTEYPFAFYIKSGHVAEYGRYDTHDWVEHKLSRALFNDTKNLDVKPEEDITILCKASKYTFDSTMNTLYESKLKGESIEGMEAKIVLNSSIGYKHLKKESNRKNRLYHVAAIAIARANQQMLDYYDILGNRVIAIIVDSIIYRGKNAIGVQEKSLGALIQEQTDCDFRMRGTNAYIFMKDGKCVDYKNSAYNHNIVTDRLEDIDKWEKVV